MEKFPQNIEKQVENIPKSETRIDVDKIAKNYAESVRETLREQKMKKADNHFENIDLDDLTDEDLIIFDKLQKGNLTEEEFNDYRKSLNPYFRQERQLKGDKYNSLKDSRSNFSAMIANKIMSKKVEEMLKERKFKKAA